MRKIISLGLIIISILGIFVIPVSAQNDANIILPETNDAIIDEVYGLYNTDVEVEVTPRATGLIISKSLKLSKTSSALKITATTTCASDVDKCGFTYIKLQRKVNGSWTDYKTYTDQYSESTSKTFSKSVSVPTAYTYRVICEHYAEKSKLLIFKDTETSYNVTSSLSF